MTIHLSQTLAIEVVGPDAAKILHNLTTNQIQSIQIGDSLETFVTDVRGWTVAHGMVFRAELERWLLVGQHPNPAAVASHIDRYIIREKAEVKNVSDRAHISLIDSSAADAVELNQGSTPRASNKAEVLWVPFNAFGSQWLIEVALDESPSENSGDNSAERSLAWEQLRIAHFWPLMGVDIWEKCIPQEIDRDEQAISFTKGCYLGQETIARLDARGQIQKKLCLLKVDGQPSAGDKLLFNDLDVGHITSCAAFKDFALALAVVRRGHFAVDTRLTCQGLPTQVIDSSTAIQIASS